MSIYLPPVLNHLTPHVTSRPEVLYPAAGAAGARRWRAVMTWPNRGKRTQQKTQLFENLKI